MRLCKILKYVKNICKYIDFCLTEVLYKEKNVTEEINRTIKNWCLIFDWVDSKDDFIMEYEKGFTDRIFVKSSHHQIKTNIYIEE